MKQAVNTLLLSSTLILSACANQGAEPPADKARGADAVAVANPAAVHCVEQGYELVEAKTDNGSTLMCVDTDSGSKCPVWKYFRQECELPERKS